jgi:putative tryptophan/tyrosine transport system substrate-binding protein
MIHRRDFITLLGGAAAAWPLAARAQQPGKLPTIGWLDWNLGRRVERSEAFNQGLAEAGYVVGRNANLDYRNAETDDDRLRALAAWRSISRLQGRSVSLSRSRSSPPPTR